MRIARKTSAGARSYYTKHRRGITVVGMLMVGSGFPTADTPTALYIRGSVTIDAGLPL